MVEATIYFAQATRVELQLVGIPVELELCFVELNFSTGEHLTDITHLLSLVTIITHELFQLDELLTQRL